MAGAVANGRRSTAAESAQVALARRLAERRSEIEQAALNRIQAIADPAQVSDPEYAAGLRAAVRGAIGYGLAGIEHGEERAPAIPAALLSQARLAARNGISLDTVLRRYVAGQALLGDFIIEEAANAAGLSGTQLKRLLRSQAVLFDRLIAAVGEEHGREPSGGRGTSSERRRAEKVKRLLAGELVDDSELGYDLDGHHLGLVAQGPDAGNVLSDLTTTLDRRLLTICREDQTVWAWLGGRQAIDPLALQRRLSCQWPASATLSLGEPSQGIQGWRLTHRQARAAMTVAVHNPEPFVRYADVALLASMLRDDLLVASLRCLYLDPLEAERDGGEVLRETLRIYFRADRNVSSTATSLGLSRRTIANRLRRVEARIGSPIRTVSVGLEAALALQSIDSAVPV